jgi:hypothetical protein
MKLCKDCKYYYSDLCKHELAVDKQSPVTGNKSYFFCGYMRRKDGICSIDAKLFEQRTGFFYKLSRLLREGGE